MPGLVALGRRWSVGSDDIIVPAVLLFVTNIFWALLLASYGIEFAIESYAQSGRKRFIIGMIIYFIILLSCMVVELVMIWYSVKGSVLNTKPREKPIVTLVYIRLALYIAQLISSILGLYFCYHYEVGLMNGTKRMLAMVIWECVLLVLLIYFMWDSSGDEWMKYRQQNDKESYQLFRDAYVESWDKTCKTLCCCVSTDGLDSGHFQEVARMFSELFVGEDLVATDVITALVLMDQERKLRERQILSEPNAEITEFCCGVPITPRTNYLQLHDAKQLQVGGEFEDMYHYMHYAWASYGYFYFLTTKCNPFAYCRWCFGLTCCCCCPNQQNVGDAEGYYELKGNDCGNANTSAVLNSFPPDSDAELFYITYENQIGETPFFIVLDHGQRSVVVVPRGTMSFDDAVTDVMLDPVEIPLDQPNPEWQGHSGMTSAGKYMYEKIMAEDLIARAQSRRRGEEPYSLIVVGHSLGAGTAPLLAIFLHQKFPNLKCYVFSPPGGLLSDAAIKGSQHYITAVVVGNDMIPRIGLNQFQELRKNLLRVLRKTDTPKYGILCGSICGRMSITLDDEPIAGNGSDRSNGATTLEYGSELPFLQNTLYPALSQPVPENRPELFLPGHVIHIVDSPKQERYLPLWTANDSFRGMMVNPKMLSDHRGDVVLKVLKKVIDEARSQA